MECLIFVCVWLGVGSDGVEWIIGLGLGFTNTVGTGEVLDVCFGCGGVGGYGGIGLGLGLGTGWVG